MNGFENGWIKMLIEQNLFPIQISIYKFPFPISYCVAKISQPEVNYTWVVIIFLCTLCWLVDIWKILYENFKQYDSGTDSKTNVQLSMSMDNLELYSKIIKGIDT